MIQIDTGTTLAAATALIIGIASVAKWIASGHEKQVAGLLSAQSESSEKALATLSTATNGRLKEQKQRIDNLEATLTETREKLFTKYASQDQFSAFRSSIENNFDTMFKRFDSLSEKVNKNVVRGKHNDD